ncbi:DUF2384 domain-containing protein [Stenotrophomonas maltophilia]|nr:DUF2384 domain-containing protein [Stenotrophomonas maltophilia]
MSYLIGIHAGLHNIFSVQRQADGWIRRPNTGRLFNGASALALMCSGQLIDLAAVREHLETNGMGPFQNVLALCRQPATLSRLVAVA